MTPRKLALATGIIVALAFLIGGERVVGVILLPLLAGGLPARQYAARPAACADR